MILSSKYKDRLEPIVASLPDDTGVYQYLDENGKVIYVGKAKNLRKRVMSYFTKTQTGKLRVLVRRIADIKFIVVDTETDALLLENNLIKKYQPRYNILLKDDKSFPWICISNEPFPRIFPTRNLIQNGSEYFGPYASVRMMNTLLELIRQIYQVRSCKLKLTENNIKQKKFKICLEYHIGNCKGPCEGLQTEDEYLQMIKEIREVIKGNIQMVIKQLNKLMMEYAAAMEFEKAQAVKEKIGMLEKYRSKSTIVNPKIDDVDVFTIIDSTDVAYVNYLKVVQGAIVQLHSIEMRKKLDETAGELLILAIADLRQRLSSNSTELILPFDPGFTLKEVKYTIPKRGDKHQLLKLSERNAMQFKMDIEKKRTLVDPERHQKRMLEQVKQDLRLPAIPEIIECFDNSNFQGDYPVAAMVQFKNAKPNKSEYRHYNIKTVTGPDDYASMAEIIQRRYSRLMKEAKPLPQLIVIDGGKGQLNAAVKSIDALGLRGKIGIIGIAKRLEEIYFPDDSLPLYIDKRSETLKLIQHLRDEAHRFGITHHRKKFEKGLIKSVLTDIQGVGYNTAQKLLWKFKSVKRISEAPEEALTETIGKAKAKTVYQHFHRPES